MVIPDWLRVGALVVGVVLVLALAAYAAERWGKR
jgi:hypothetical protein